MAGGSEEDVTFAKLIDAGLAGGLARAPAIYTRRVLAGLAYHLSSGKLR